MENFTGKDSKGMKEKSVYLLHLDTPRIIIIASVIIGIMIISFLVGMNINKESGIKDTFLQEEPLFNTTTEKKNNYDIFDEKAILAPPIEDEIAENKSSSEKAPIPVNDEIIKYRDIQKRKPSLAKKEKVSSEILTNENIKDIIPPAKEVLKTSSKRTIKAIKKRSSVKVKSKKRRKRKKERIVEVATKKRPPVILRDNNNHYAIQVASYDKKTKALTESSKLEKMRYNAYLEKTKISGKKFYRVRIGPIFSMKKAIKMLNEIQEVERYENSFMVKN